MGVNDEEKGENVDKDSGDEFTEEELRLGRRASKFMNRLCVAAFLASIAVGLFVIVSVPWETRMPYDGRFDRSGAGIPMQIAMLPILLVLFGLWRSGQKPDSYKMHSGSRIGIYVLGTGLILGCVLGQWTMAKSILTAGGYFGN